MKRMVRLVMVLVMCAALVCPVFASTFVPSISYKDGPSVEEGTLQDKDVSDCLVVSSITDATEKTTDITQEDRDLLLEVYEKLTDGSMKLPLDGDYVIRELVDVSFKQTACVDAGHGHKDELAKEGVTIAVDFDLGVNASTEVVVLAYVNGEWVAIESVANNGDGTITCVFEEICPVAFCVDAEDLVETPKTGDDSGQSLILWVTLLIVSLAAIVVLLVRRKKAAR